MKLKKKAAEMSQRELARFIDYSVLKPEFTEEEIIKLTKDCVKLGCFNLCINPSYMDLCLPYFECTDTKLSPVLDFPFGTSSTECKVEQAKILCRYPHISEMDMVANYGWIRSEKYEAVEQDIRAVAEIVHAAGYGLKVILETDALTEAQIRKACHSVAAAGADFVKTSTGFLTGHECVGGTPEIIQIMLDEVGDQIKVKGSGCIRTREHFLKLIDMGVERMGIGYKSVPVVLGLQK